MLEHFTLWLLFECCLFLLQIHELWDTLVKLCIALGSKIPFNEKCKSLQKFCYISKLFTLWLWYPPQNHQWCVHFFSSGNSQVWVKLRLAAQGYNSAEFYSLPSDETSGSRELLLALMWIIASENALANLTQECVRRSPLCQEYSDAPMKEVARKYLSNIVSFISYLLSLIVL